MGFIRDKGTRLHYQVMGNGPEALLAFHGYGQESGYFQTMVSALGHRYTIYAFDLFFHGRSALSKTDLPLQKRRLQELMALFLETEKIEDFSLMGFSMGGKFVLSALEAFAPKVRKIYLIAPDGISTSFWYSMATYPGFLQQLFKQSVVKPDRLFKFLNFLDRKRLVDKGLVRFAHWQMESRPKRLRVYRSWVGFRPLAFDIRRIVELLNRHEIPLELFVGQFDRVIEAKRLEIFAKALRQSRMHVLPTGHTFLLQDVAGFIRKHKIE